MKNAIGAWVTILLMGVGTAAATAHAAKIERAQAEKGRVVRLKRPRLPRPVADTASAVEERQATPAVTPTPKPAPAKPYDTRGLSRVSQRRA